MSRPTQGTTKRNGGVYVVSLGCPKNQVDTEVMLGVMNEEGHTLVDSPEDADTLLVNTCGFIESAKEESIETILEMAQIKAQGEGKKLVVTGCLSQRYAKELEADLPEVDHFLGSADQLGLRDVLRGQSKRNAVSELDRRAYLYDHTSPRQTYGHSHFNYVKITEGCDRPCSFCIIPKLRGPQRSRSIESLVVEATRLSEQGTREICLIGQDLTTYGKDLGPGHPTFEQLLDALVEVKTLDWIRLHYAFPTTTTPGVVERIAQQDKIATYLDVPLQHVDTDVLKKMRRGYTERQVRALVENVRAQDKYIWLRTTMLVGHPGETEDAFKRLEAFISEGHIDHLGVFPWSREEGTPSAMQPDRIDPEIAQERATRLMEIQAGHRKKRHAELLGTILPVMIDGESDESEFLLDGRHEGQAPEIDGKVLLCDGTGSPGDIVQAKVIQTGIDDIIVSFDHSREVEAAPYDDEEFEFGPPAR